MKGMLIVLEAVKSAEKLRQAERGKEPPYGSPAVRGRQGRAC